MHRVAVLTNLAKADFQAPLLAIKDFTEVTPECLHELFGQLGEVPKANDEVAKDQNLQPVEEDKN
jgi:hypothetical protein